jgi:probable HAF family extracellular repeat protein
MSALRRLRNFWIPLVTMIVLACFGNAFAQASYQVTDLGVLPNRDLGCAMGLNNRGWTEIMEGTLAPGSENSASGILLSGRAAIDINGTNFDLGTLGGKNSWTNYGGINEQGETVGYAETAVLDPNGEDVCLFGTGLTCSPFLWRNGHMHALPTLGGNNGQASAINNNGQIAGYAENGILDSTCPSTVRNNRIDLPVLWENGVAEPLPTVGTDPDGVAFGINNPGQAAGYSGTCTSANHAVRWEKDGTAVPLDDLGVPGASEGFGINDQGEIIGITLSSDGATFYAAVWHGTAITSLNTLPGDVNSLGEGINNQGQVVGSTQNSHGDWSHAFLWQNGVMIDINTLFPANSNLYATMANQINDKGQISGMAVVITGPHTGEIHAFVATPVNASLGRSIADVASTLPKPSLPANVGNQLLHRFGPNQLVR